MLNRPPQNKEEEKQIKVPLFHLSVSPWEFINLLKVNNFNPIGVIAYTCVGVDNDSGGGQFPRFHSQSPGMNMLSVSYAVT